MRDNGALPMWSLTGRCTLPVPRPVHPHQLGFVSSGAVNPHATALVAVELLRQHQQAIAQYCFIAGYYTFQPVKQMPAIPGRCNYSRQDAQLLMEEVAHLVAGSS